MQFRFLISAVFPLLLAICGAAQAQPAPASLTEAGRDAPGAADDSGDGSATAAPQRSVRTVQRDAGSSIEELRVGGQTREITVQPAGAAPAYQVRPSNNHSLRQDTGRHSGDGTNGPRVWNVLQF